MKHYTDLPDDTRRQLAWLLAEHRRWTAIGPALGNAAQALSARMGVRPTRSKATRSSIAVVLEVLARPVLARRLNRLWCNLAKNRGGLRPSVSELVFMVVCGGGGAAGMGYDLRGQSSRMALSN